MLHEESNIYITTVLLSCSTFWILQTVLRMNIFHLSICANMGKVHLDVELLRHREWNLHFYLKAKLLPKVVLSVSTVNNMVKNWFLTTLLTLYSQAFLFKKNSHIWHKILCISLLVISWWMMRLSFFHLFIDIYSFFCYLPVHNL